MRVLQPLLPLVLLLAACRTAPKEIDIPPLVACTGPDSTLITRPAAASESLLEWRPKGGGEWRARASDPALRPDQRCWSLDGLQPGTEYEYRILEGGRETGGRFVTARPPGVPFSFALISDPHIYVRDFTPAELAAMPLDARTVERCGSVERALWIRRAERAHGRAILPRVAVLVEQDRPDFLINLGDVLDLHGIGFNAPLPDASWARRGYRAYRALLGPLGATCAHFMVLGNWDCEKEYFSEPQRAMAREERLAWLPNPAAGAGPNRDYYSFRWGDAHFIVLNVVSYSRSGYSLDPAQAGSPEEHTLGPAQFAWLEATLAGSDAPWKFVCMHHPAGGRGGDPANSAYGRGGGRAAQVGEQARIHALMRRHGVQILFHGHDHVFSDMVVDGIHYTLPGSCGAPWKFTKAETGYERYWPASGYARVRVEPERVRVEFISADEELLHQYVIERK